MTKSKILDWYCFKMLEALRCDRSFRLKNVCHCMSRIQLSAMLDELIQSVPDRGAITIHLDEIGSLEERQEYVKVTTWKKEASK